jgi:hypothetical protein
MLLVVVHAAFAALQSGQFVPLSTKAGFLACPQPLTTLQGIGQCVGIVPLRAAAAGNASSADVFAQCTAQCWPKVPAQGGSFMYRLPFIRRDSKGLPVFGSPISLPQQGVLPDMRIMSAWPTCIPRRFGGGDRGEVYAAAFSSDCMHVLLLQNGVRWLHLTSSKFKLPASWGGLSCSTVRATPPGGW